MSIIPPISPPATPGSAEVDYPSSDGRPLAETPLHRDVLVTAIDVLGRHFADQPRVYVSGNMLVFYEPGNKRKHVSPDVFVVFGVLKDKPRDYYLVWEEGRGPDVVLEITSRSTQDEDVEQKLALYRDVLKVPEYFLFDPRAEYLVPPLKGYRLREGQYQLITPDGGQWPSVALGLNLEADGDELRFHDPIAGCWLPTQAEIVAAERAMATEQRAQAEAQRQRADRQQAEIERLRREIELLKRRPPEV